MANGRGTLPDRLHPRVVTSRWYAKAYGWTPDQVAELPIEEYEWLPAIEMAESDAIAARQKQDEVRNRPRRRR
jgi:hypothetical protein